MNSRLRRVSVASRELLFAEALANPEEWAVLLDYDGTTAPIVAHPDRARPGDATRAFLRDISDLFQLVAFVSGREAAFLRRQVGLSSIHYVGLYGAEEVRPGQTTVSTGAEFLPYVEPLHRFTEAAFEALAPLGVEYEDKGLMVAFHWRNSPDRDAAERAVTAMAARARDAGWFVTENIMNWEVRPPIPLTKDDAATRVLAGRHWRGVIVLGDERSDMHTWAGAERLQAMGMIDRVIKIGVTSDHTPREMPARATLMVPGVRGVDRILRLLSSAAGGADRAVA